MNANGEPVRIDWPPKPFSRADLLTPEQRTEMQSKNIAELWVRVTVLERQIAEMVERRSENRR